jgi:ribose-phosphate pyrophosphokinase
VTAASIQSLPSSVSDAARLGAYLGISVHEIAIHKFPDGEFRVTVARPTPLTIVYGSLDRPNEKLLALLFAAESLRRNGARRLVLVAPYLCYMRQDTAFRAGEAISQNVVGRILAGAFDHVITVNAHLHRIASIRDVFPGIETQNLSAMAAVAAVLRTAGLDPATVVIGPDAESQPWVSELARRLGLTAVVAQKTRHSDRSVEVVLAEPKAVVGRPVLLIDDIVSSGGTLIACARSVIAAGATVVDAVVVHALFPPELLADLARAGIRSVRSTTSVPHPTNAIPLDEVIATALRYEVNRAGAEEETS